MSVQPKEIRTQYDHYTLVRILTGWLDMNGNEIKNYRSEMLSQTSIDGIATPVEAREIYNSTTHKKGYFNGTSWVYLSNNRADHTGTQLASTISNFEIAAQQSVGAILTDTYSVDFTYDDANHQIKAALILASGSGLEITSTGVRLTDTGVSAGTYPKVTVDAKGRVTTGAALTAGDLPPHNSMHTGMRLSEFTPPNANLDLNNVRLTNIADPVNAQDAVNLRTLNATQEGLNPKGGVRVVATSNITLSGSQTIDGETTVTGDRVLLTAQSNPAENGIWIANSSGAWTRASDANVWSELVGAHTFVIEGSASYKGTGWLCTVEPGGTLGATAVTWIQYTGSGTIVDGAGLGKSGNEIFVKVDDQTIKIDTDILKAKLLTSGGIAYSAGGMYIDVDDTTIGLSAGKLIIKNDFRTPHKYKEVTGNGSATSFAWNHGLGTYDFILVGRDPDTGAEVEVGIDRVDTNNINLVFAQAPVLNKKYNFFMVA